MAFGFSVCFKSQNFLLYFFFKHNFTFSMIVVNTWTDGSWHFQTVDWKELGGSTGPKPKTLKFLKKSFLKDRPVK